MNKIHYYQTIDFLRFPLIFLIIVLHSYTVVNINNDCYWKIIYPFLTIGELGVPSFFFISGFLYFFNIRKDCPYYLTKTKSRLKTLLIPYLIWNSVFIVFYALIQNIPIFSPFFSGLNKPITNYSIIDYIQAFVDKGDWDHGNGTPILQPYWYIRNLMVLCLFSPILLFLIKYLKWIGIFMLGTWWLMTPGIAFLSSSIFFFSLGALFAIHSIDFLNESPFIKKTFIILFACLFVIDYLTHTIPMLSVPYNLFIHRITLILGIYCIFIIGYIFQDNFKWNNNMINASFFIYTVHYPIILALRKISIRLITYNNGIIQFLSYVTCVILTTIICLLLYKLLHILVPKILNISIGNRNNTNTK